MRLLVKPAAALLSVCLTVIGLAGCDQSSPWGSGGGFGIDGLPPAQKKETHHKRTYTSGGVGGGAALESHDKQVREILRGWIGASTKQQNLIVARFRRDRGLQPGLVRIIELESRYLLPAIEIAGRIDLEDAMQFLHLIVLNGKPKPKAAAMLALDRMDPWSDKRLADFLTALEEEVLVAALQICKSRAAPPVAPMIRLLGDARRRVRQAAYDAMPEECNDEAAQRELLELTNSETTPVAVIAVRTLGDFADFPGKQKRLAELVGESRMTVRLAAQSALAKVGKRLSNDAVQAIHARLIDAKAGVREKLTCLVALERTRSIDSDWLAREAKNLHPTARLHAARCLVLAGHPAGVEILIEGLSLKKGPGVDGEDVDYVRAGSRAVLVELLGKDVGNDPAAWRKHEAALVRARPKRLRSPHWKNR